MKSQPGWQGHGIHILYNIFVEKSYANVVEKPFLDSF